MLVENGLEQLYHFGFVDQKVVKLFEFGGFAQSTFGHIELPAEAVWIPTDHSLSESLHVMNRGGSIPWELAWGVDDLPLELNVRQGWNVLVLDDCIQVLRDSEGSTFNG